MRLWELTPPALRAGEVVDGEAADREIERPVEEGHRTCLALLEEHVAHCRGVDLVLADLQHLRGQVEQEAWRLNSSLMTSR